MILLLRLILLAQLDLSDNEIVCADRGFDSDTFRRLIQSKQSKANIPYKKNREHLNVGTDWYLYKNQALGRKTLLHD